MDNESCLFSVDGVNRAGKGGVLLRARLMLELMAFINYGTLGEKPFRTASIMEPPQLPLTDFALHPAARNAVGKLYTWRNMLKEGDAAEILRLGSPDSASKDLAYAEGFLTSRSIIERYMFEEFPWTFGCELNPFINMLPNIFRSLPNGMGWYDVDFRKVVVKDRGSASTAVFQGIYPGVRELMSEIYGSGDVRIEDLTVILSPSNLQNWMESDPKREADRDVHDGNNLAQFDRYASLRKDWGRLFSKNIIYLENDPSGMTNDIIVPSILLAVLFLSYIQNREMKWYDETQELNNVNVNLIGSSVIVPRVLYADLIGKMYEYVTAPSSMSFEGIPLILVSGDVGLARLTHPNSAQDYEYKIVLAEDLSKRIVFK